MYLSKHWHRNVFLGLGLAIILYGRQKPSWSQQKCVQIHIPVSPVGSRAAAHCASPWQPALQSPVEIEDQIEVFA